ncbi:uncharacterized protein LOC109504592 [Harpegnathos saltator]|uniref:uncharacterized protein LOC109504592 n=1 Tax=Harpegnathos saltator TaxID=610380 RepID=UPI000DBED136|nr:uncharacterized protein LOC109504592 [Harpegnathos saltator]
MNLKLVVTENGSPVIEHNKLVVWDVDGNCPVHLDMTPENLVSFNLQVKINSSGKSQETETLLSNEQLTVNCENASSQSQQLTDISSKKKNATSWKDNHAVKTLIEEWREHENYFKSTTITNKKVWEMIASRLKKENPLWNYTGQQCEDKFKDLRKHYIKARDQNEKSSGLPVVTCKFYKEMDDVLGDKPAVKPICIASTLKKRYQPDSQDSSSTASATYTVIVKMTVIVVMIVPLNLKRKEKCY